MRKIHVIPQNNRAIPKKAAGVQPSGIPLIPTLLAWFREKRLKEAAIGQDESWKAAYMIFTTLRSYSKGNRQPEKQAYRACIRIEAISDGTGA